MTSREILKADVLDILFDNRNKQYGAYALRKNYHRRLSLSLAIAMSTVLIFSFVFRSNHRSTQAVFKPDEVVVRSYPVPPEIKTEKKMVKPKETKPPPRQQKFTPYIVKHNDLVKNQVIDQKTLMDGLISKITVNGREPELGDVPGIKDPVSNEMSKEEKEVKFILKDREPEFPGGQEAWLNFLRKNLVAPAELEAGEKKTVVVRFLVSTDGSVTGFEIMQSGGRSFDNEVIRVLKRMPMWKPAIQNGSPVTRAYLQPVTFVGVEQ